LRWNLHSIDLSVAEIGIFVLFIIWTILAY
jgi:hypothetical protein